MSQVPTPAELKHLAFFASLDEAELAHLAEHARLHALEADEALFHEGDPLDPALRFVFSGGLQIRKTAASGKETVLRLLRPGDMFGVAALFDRKVAPGTAIATEPTKILEIRQDDMVAHLAAQPQLAMKLLVTFAQRLREAQDTLHMVISGRAKTRLARQILLALEKGGATATHDGLQLKTRLPHATLSRLIGITYEECVRLIREWSHDPPLLHYSRGGVITIRDQARLEQEAREE